MSDVLLAVVIAGSLAGFLALARHHYRSRLEQWRDLIEPTGEQAAERVAESCALDQMMADHAFGAAERAREALDLSEAIRLLELALRVLEEATPSRIQRLRIMGRLVRMSMAILPLEAVPRSRFRLARVGFVARVGAILDSVVVAPAERMSIRLKVLILGFGLTLHVLRASTRVAGRRPSADAPWDRFRLALADWNTLDDEHLRSMRALLAAIAVELNNEEIAHQTH